MKNGWEIKKLGDLTDFITKGTTPTSLGHSFVPSGVNFVKVESIEDSGEFIAHKLAHITNECHEILKRSQLNFGDILFSIAGALGRTAFVTEDILPANTNQALSIIRLKKSTELLPAFILLSLSSGFVLEQVEKFKGGVAQQNLSLAQVRAFNIPIPSRQEQQRIVAILDEAFEGIATAKANAEKNLKNARQLFESHLNSVFSQRGEGWVEKTLGDTAKVKGGKRVPKGYQLSTNQTDFPYIRVTDFTDNGSIDMGDLRYISADVHNKIKNYVIYSEDLYISIAGTIGKTGIIPDELNGSNLTENACRLAFKPGLSNRFVYYFTLTSSFIEQAGVNTRTAAQPKLALSRLSTIKLGVPSVQAQQRLVDDFDALCEETQRLESIYQKKIDALDALKKSILQKAFSGEL